MTWKNFRNHSYRDVKRTGATRSLLKFDKGCHYKKWDELFCNLVSPATKSEDVSGRKAITIQAK